MKTKTQKINTKQLTTMALLCAMAFIMGALIRIRGIFPAAPFLTYDPKDVVILIGGFMFGPLSALLMSVVVALLEMVTISDSGLIGAVMNAIASASFTCTAAFIYKRKRDFTGAVIGLAVGVLITTATMLLWNFLMVPIYTGWPRERVVAIMLPALLPFNLAKATVNAMLALVWYKHVSKVLKLLPL